MDGPQRLWAFGTQMFGYFSIYKEKKKQMKASLRKMSNLITEEDGHFS